MGRAIIAARDGSKTFDALPKRAGASGSGVAETAEEKPDVYRERLFKYIPAEVVSLYLGLAAILASATDAPAFLHWVIFVVCLIGTPFYLWSYQKVTAPAQLVISTLAFVVWIAAIGGPFQSIPGYKQVYGAILLPIFTFFVAGFSPRRAHS